MTTLEQIRSFLLLNKDVLRNIGIATRAKINHNTLQKFIAGEKHRHLTEAQIERLVPVLNELGFTLKNE